MPLVVFTSGIFRVTLGLAALLFFPGYTLIAALYPRRTTLGDVERLALSFGLSIAVVPLICLALNYTPWGIRLYSILFSVLLFIFIMSAIAWFRRRSLPSDERFQVQLRVPRWPWSGPRAPQGSWDRLMNILLALAILGALGTMAYVVAQPKTGEQFTEFYVLNSDGVASNYPSVIVIGEKTSVIVGVINHEFATITYRLEITVDGQAAGVAIPVLLKDGEKWENSVSFTPTHVGDNQKVEFLLYKEAGAEPYLAVHLWLSVKEAG